MKIKKVLPLGGVLIILAATLWAIDGLLRRSLYSLDPLVVVFYEHLIGSLILIPFFIREKFPVFKKSTFFLIAIVSLFSGLLGTLWFTSALVQINFIPFSVVLLIQKLQPIFATSSAALILKERITKKYAVWASIAILAAFFVTFKNGVIASSESEHFSAVLYALGAAIAWGTSTTFSKLLLKEVNTITATSLRFFTTTIFAFIGCLLFLPSQEILTIISLSQFFRFLIIALSTGMVALYLYYEGLKRTEAKITTILELTFPLLGVVIDAVIFKNYLSFSQLLAATVLMIAIIKTGQLNKKQ